MKRFQDERIIVDVLRQVIAENIPAPAKKKFHTMFQSFMAEKEFV